MPRTRQGVLHAVEALGARACSYTMGDEWANLCDCKYGMESDRSAAERVTYCGEQTGCPEMRDLRNLLAEMTDDEYGEIQDRALRRVLADPDVRERLAQIAKREGLSVSSGEGVGS